MKNFKNLLLVALFFTSAIVFGQRITGTVVDELGQPLPGASVVEKGTTNGASTDFDGKFMLNPKSSNGTIVFSFVGYLNKSVAFTSAGDLGTIQLATDANTLDEVVVVGKGVIDLAEDRETPVAVSTVKAVEIQERAIGNVEVPEIVKSTPSVYVSGQNGFGDSQMFLRGFDQTNIAVLLNGQPVNGMEDGRVYWSNWAGIADVANGVQVQRGLGSSKLAISSVGGTINLVMKSAERKEGGFVRFLGGNDGYAKGTASYNTGLSDSGWSFSVLLDYWQADRKWAEGTFGKGQTYFLAAGYNPEGSDHSFGFLLTGAPQQHGQRWSQSASQIEENPRFNQHWGFTESLNSTTNNYSSAIKSERTNYYHKPVLNVNWDWDIDEESTLSTVGYASWGRGGGTGPRGNGRQRTADGQIDYYGIEQNNALVGLGGDYGAANGAGYIRRASVNNHQWFGLVSNFEKELSEYVNFNAGVDLRFYTGDHFRQVVDFYGLSGWSNDRTDGAVVTNSFDINPWSALFDFAGEGDRIAYDYSEDINYQGVFSQIEYSKNKFSTFFQGAVSNQSYQRNGRMRSPGKSESVSKIGYNLKGGLAYKITDEIKIFGNGGYYSRQPFLDNIFTNIRNSDELVTPEVDNEDIASFELGWRFDNQRFFAGFDFYYTNWDNRVITSSGESTLPGGTIVETNIFRRGVEQTHIGTELDMRYRVLDNLTLKGFWSQGSWKYDRVERVDTYNDNDATLLSSVSGGIARSHVPNAPQTSIGAGIDYEPIEGLKLRTNWNYYDRHFITERFNRDGFQFKDVGMLPDYFLVDAGLTYKFDLGEQTLEFNGNVYNIFDRIALNGTDPFGYFNTNGTTFNASVKYKF